MTTPASCDLCGLDLGRAVFRLATPAGEKCFCCEACRGIYTLLQPEEVPAASPADALSTPATDHPPRSSS